jgi:hypothetical protein
MLALPTGSVSESRAAVLHCGANATVPVNVGSGAPVCVDVVWSVAKRRRIANDYRHATILTHRHLYRLQNADRNGNGRWRGNVVGVA